MVGLNPPMRFPTARCLVLIISVVCLALGLPAESGVPPTVEFPSLSPLSTLKQRIGLTDIEVVYSRPGVKGRHIFGNMHAYGEIWRTGANAATKITFSTPVKFNNVDVPAGSYALFTIPDKDEWTVILNSDWAQWGHFLYDKAKDVVRVKATPITLPYLVETFTIDFDDIRDESATLVLSWEKIRVPVKLQVEVASKVLPQIDAMMAYEGKKAPGVYFGAAQFYFDHDQDLNKALGWIDQALSLNPDAHYMLHLKAKILAKLGKKAEAIAAAKRSTQLAIEAKDLVYVKLNQDLISSLP